jgi:transposase
MRHGGSWGCVGLKGYTRGEAASCGIDRQTLRDWVIRYNAQGVAGLSDRTSPGPKPRLTPEQGAAVAEQTSPRMVSCAGAGWIWPG